MTEDLLIVAAGTGSRLRAKGNLKPLVEVGGKALIEYAIGAAFDAGLTRATVVTGYHAEILESYLAELAKRTGWQIDTIHNPEFLKPNGLSVLKARERIKGPFCLAMCDHIVDPELYRRLLAADRGDDTVALAVDRRMDNPYVDLEDVTRVQLNGQYIAHIGKEMPTYNAFDTGIFAAGPALFDAIAQSGDTSGDYSISGGMRILASEQRALGVDVGDAFWIDVDSPEMYELANRWLGTSQTATA